MVHRPRRAVAGSSPSAPFHEIETILQEAGVSTELQRLVDQKCDRLAVLATLATLQHLDRKLDTLEFWTGLNRRQLKGLRRRLRDTATEVEPVNARPLRALLAERKGAAALVALPDTLRHYAAVCQNLLDEVSGQKHPQQDIAVSTLVRYVRLSTGQYRDREVSALVSAVLDKDYSTKMHQEWRRAKYSRLAQALDRQDR